MKAHERDLKAGAKHCAYAPFLAPCTAHACVSPLPPVAAPRRCHQARAACCGGAHRPLSAHRSAEATHGHARCGCVPSHWGGSGCAQLRRCTAPTAGGEGCVRRGLQCTAGHAGKWACDRHLLHAHLTSPAICTCEAHVRTCATCCTHTGQAAVCNPSVTCSAH